MSGTGIEPMSPAWKADMLTTTPTAQLLCCRLLEIVLVILFSPFQISGFFFKFLRVIRQTNQNSIRKYELVVSFGFFQTFGVD